MGEGRTDDTVAIQHALASLRERQMLYFPTGAYLVSQTLTYPRVSRNLITQGQDRDSTIIKLKDWSSGFDDPAHPQPVMATQDGNRAFGYGFFNLTIDIGSGNPGASGIDYISNNQGAIDRVRIVSSDSAKRGARGLDMSRKWPGPALVQHVEVHGFDYGIYIDQWIYSMTFEHLTLKGQRQAGIRDQNNVIAIRDLKSVNTVPVIQNRSGTVTVVDGRFVGGSPSVAAIEHEGRPRGALFVCNTATFGFIVRRLRVTGRSSLVSLLQSIPQSRRDRWLSPRTSIR
jgi:hypothetical protein